MLKKMINSARIEMEIIPVDPLLVKSGMASVTGADMAFVRTHRFGGKAEPYIPGSSVKGMIRSYAEKICRSLRENPYPVCLPYVSPDDVQQHEQRQVSCGQRIDQLKPNISSAEIYRLSCPACRLFGSLGAAGRLATADAYITETFRDDFIEIRDCVAIDRFSGGAARGAKFDLEVLTRGEFATVIEVRNFERWQLGLLGLVLRDMEEGLVRLGFAKSRGLGRFNARIDRFDLTYYHRSPADFTGIGALCSDEERDAYGFFKESGESGAPLPEGTVRGLRHVHDITENWKTVLEPGVRDFLGMIESVQWPQELESYSQRRG